MKIMNTQKHCDLNFIKVIILKNPARFKTGTETLGSLPQKPKLAGLNTQIDTFT